MNSVSLDLSNLRVLTRHTSAAGLVAVLLGCAGSAPPVDQPATVAPAESTPVTPKAATSEPEPELSAEAAALIAESEGKPAPQESPSNQKSGSDLMGNSGKTGHELTYRVKPDSLLIQVAGASFLPRVKSKKLKNGFGIEIELEAKSDAGVVLAQSDSGPMSLAVQIAGKKEVIGDKKTDGVDKAVTAPTLFRRSWPNEESSALKPGEVAEVQVGLWGLGTSETDKKPLRRFFVVTVKVDQKGATVTVAPPKGTGK